MSKWKTEQKAAAMFRQKFLDIQAERLNLAAEAAEFIETRSADLDATERAYIRKYIEYGGTKAGLGRLMNTKDFGTYDRAWKLALSGVTASVTAAKWKYRLVRPGIWENLEDGFFYWKGSPTRIHWSSTIQQNDVVDWMKVPDANNWPPAEEVEPHEGFGEEPKSAPTPPPAEEIEFDPDDFMNEEED